MLLCIFLTAAPAVHGAARDQAEAKVAVRFDQIADSPAQLRMFLQAMPKGADLHNHLGGSVYAEDYLRWAGDQGMCIATDSNSIVPPPCDAPGRMPARDLASKAYLRYAQVVDTLSTRGVEQGIGDPVQPARERFFAAFDGFRPISQSSFPAKIATAREAAAGDRVSYVELIAMPLAAQPLLEAAKKMRGDANDFAKLASTLAPMLPAAIARARADLDRYDAQVAAMLGCNGAAPRPACDIEVRYQVPSQRSWPAPQVFAALAFGFALADTDPRWVGVNLLGPEHHPASDQDYALHMRMLAHLKKQHPGVPMSLHAGELTLGLVPPRYLRSHIHDAVVCAGAARIGHGVDIAYEHDAAALLKRMARDEIAVEINLTSNAVILGVKGKDHPLTLYRAAGVPVVLSTDDQGVLRSDMTHEYLRAVREHGLRYLDLKQIARDGLQYAFLPGASLWQTRAGGARVPECAALSTTPDAACTRFLGGSPKARLQWRLERDLGDFERAMLEDADR
nr:adenosine deaminase [Lysobacter capsici]